MKNLLKSLALVAVSALAVVSCQKDELASQNDGEGVFFSLRTGDAGKTYIVAGEGEDAGKYLPKWNKGDQVKVFFGDPDGTNNTPYGPLTNQNEDGQTADFQGTITGYEVPGEGDLYAFYPASSFKQVYATGVGLELPVLQNPTASSFDPAADILVSKKTTFLYDSDENYWFAEPQFARIPAILKINVFSSSFEPVQGDVISKFTVESSSNEIAGRLVVDFAEELGKVNKVNSPSKSVSAVYDTERYISVGTAATSTNCSVFLLVNAGEFAAGSTLTFKGVGATYNIKKVINIDEVVEKTGKPFVLTPGNLTEINLSLAEENCEIPTESDWKLVKNVNDLAAGDLIEIGCSSKKAAAGALYSSSNKYFTKVSATFSEDGETMDSDDAAILVLGGNATDGWSLTLDGKQVGYSGTDLALNDELWTISITETGVATIAEKKTPSNKMRYNSNSGQERFKPYSSGQQDVQIYKFYGTREPLAAPANVKADIDQDKANKINVSWDAVDNAAAYEVVFTAGGKDIVEKVETNSIAEDGLEFDTEYAIKVKAFPSDYLTYTDSEYSNPVNVKTNPKPAGLVYYKKVTSSLDDWSGEYLIVAESAKKVLTYSKNSTSGYKAADIDISNSQIESNANTNAHKVIIATDGTAYSVCINGAYLSKPSSSGRIAEVSTVESDAARWTPSTSGLVNKESNGWSLRYNSNVTDANGPFRIYSTTAMTVVTLYKLDDPRTPLATPVITVTPNSKAKTIKVEWTCTDQMKIANYNITCGDNPSYTTQSGTDGNYTFENVVPGTYVVTVVANPSDAATYKPSKATESATIEDLTPVISYTTPSTADADATSLEFAYTITNPVEGQKLSVAITEGDDWITAAGADAEKVTVSFGQNTTSAVRTGKVTLSYPGAKADKVVTVTQKGASLTYASLEDLVAAGTPTSTGTTVTVTFSNKEIIDFYKSGQYTNGIWLPVVGAPENKIEIFCWNVPAEWEVGGLVSGTLSDCKWVKYSDTTWELCPADWSEISYACPCATPEIALDGANATITCATAGATILYEISDTEPASFTHTYSSAVTLTDGQTIWAKATLAGYPDSKVASKKYTAGGVETKTFTITSGDVVSNASYAKYEKTVDNRGWIITFGGNNKSVGTNSNNRSKCNLSSYSKYAVSPVTTSDVASAFACTTKLTGVKKISYTINGGSSQTSTKVYVIYSADGNTFSQITLTSGTQGATISSGTVYEFNSCEGYFALLFKATNSSGNWRIDDVNVEFTYED